MEEKTNLEFKSEYTKSFLKTVSAFANYDGGEILFGVNDNGTIVGLDKPKDVCQRIENSINDTLEPLPTYSINVEENNDKKIIRLTVLSGPDTPYCVSGKAYKRSHTSTIKVDSSELKRLVLKGMNTSFEECPSENQSLKFSFLDCALKRKLDLDEVDDKVYKTLGLYTSQHGFNNAAAVLADKNNFFGIDIVKFGKNISEMMERKTIEHASALELYDQAIAIFDRYYKFEVINAFERKEDYLIPEIAYREAIANALVHRDWSVNGNVKVSFYDNRIEIVSPGGLPHDISEEDYLTGRVSVLRNPIIAEVFAKLGHIEKFGTGIPRIKEAYKRSGLAPRFSITTTSIAVILPNLSLLDELNENERNVLKLLEENDSLKRSEIEDYLDTNKSKVTRILKQLEDKNLIEVEGIGRATRYKL